MPATADARKLRAEFVAAILAEVERLGEGGLKKAPLVAGFVGRGASRTTLYRWLEEVIATGAPGLHLSEKVKQATADRAEAHPDAEAASEAVAAEAVDILPRPARFDQAILGGGVGEMISQLRECVKTGQQVAAYARTPEGAVRNAKLLLSASEHLRRALDTTAKLQTMAADLLNVEGFHRAIFDELRQASPELAENVLARLRRLHVAWTMGQ